MAAAADCPGPDALSTGIEVVGASGVTDMYRRLDDGTVEHVFVDAGGSGGRVLFEPTGIYVLFSEALEGQMPVPGTQVTFAYPGAAAGLPDPGEPGRWQVDLTRTTATDVISEPLDIEFGEPEARVIGPCSYATIPVLRTLAPGIVERADYLPDLGLSLYAGTRVDGVGEVVVYDRIEALAP
ncbi:MAG: hypothetical protein AAF914_02720 [Pseudomonadota bacterium]